MSSATATTEDPRLLANFSAYIKPTVHRGVVTGWWLTVSKDGMSGFRATFLTAEKGLRLDVTLCNQERSTLTAPLLMRISNIVDKPRYDRLYGLLYNYTTVKNSELEKTTSVTTAFISLLNYLQACGVVGLTGENLTQQTIDKLAWLRVNPLHRDAPKPLYDVQPVPVHQMA